MEKERYKFLALMVFSASVNAADLPSPVLLKPDNGANLPFRESAKFTWKKVTGATKYRLIFSNDKSFANYDANKFKCLNTKTCFMYTVTSTSYTVSKYKPMLNTLTPRLSSPDHFWQVQAVNSKDRSQITTPTTKAGEVRSFSVGTVPAAIDITSPYTKIANDGSELSENAVLGTKPKDWACTKDNNTGLIWEVKTSDGGLHDTNSKYTNYISFDDENITKVKTNSLGFVSEVNNEKFCGKNNWRLPTDKELQTLVYCSDGKYNPSKNDEYFEDFVCSSNTWDKDLTSQPVINTVYFPNTNEKEPYWTSFILGYMDRFFFEWVIDFNNGYEGRADESYKAFVRLVSN